MGWLSHTAIQTDGTVHVWPDYEDGHVTEPGAACFCRPRLEEHANGNVTVIHNDYVDREWGDVA